MADDLSPLGVFLVRQDASEQRLLFKYPYQKPKDFRLKILPKNPYAIGDAPAEIIFRPRSASIGDVLDGNYVTISDKALSNLFACPQGLCNQKFELKVNNVRFVGHPVMVQAAPVSSASSILSSSGSAPITSDQTSPSHVAQNGCGLSPRRPIGVEAPSVGGHVSVASAVRTPPTASVSKRHHPTTAGSSLSAPTKSSMTPLLNRGSREVLPNRSRSGLSADVPLQMLNVVFALKAQASHEIVQQYHDLSKKIALALCKEESHSHYFTQQCRLMVQILDTSDAIDLGVSALDHNYSNENSENEPGRSQHLSPSGEASSHPISDRRQNIPAAGGALTVCRANNDGKNLNDENDAPLCGVRAGTCAFEKIVEKSDLARMLRQAFVDLCASGALYLKINGKNLMPFCVVHKTHKLNAAAARSSADATGNVSNSSSPGSGPTTCSTPLTSLSAANHQINNCCKQPNVSPVPGSGLIAKPTKVTSAAAAAAAHSGSDDVLRKCMEQISAHIKPYHALLLVVTPEELLGQLSSEYRRALDRLIKCASATKNMIELGYDADIVLDTVLELAFPLVYFAHAIVIFPVKPTNRYVVAPNAPTNVHHLLVAEFARRFGSSHGGGATSSGAGAGSGSAAAVMTLPSTLADFSQPTSVAQLYSPQLHEPNHQDTLLKVVVWCLQKRILMQVHTYVYLVLPDGQTENTLSWPTVTSTLSEFRESSVKTTKIEDINPSDGGDSTSDESQKKSERQIQGSEKSPDWQEAPAIWRSMNSKQRKFIEHIPAFKKTEERKLFLKLLPFFDGKSHLEHMMYCANVTRARLNLLLEQFQNVLTIVEHPDPAFEIFYR